MAIYRGDKEIVGLYKGPTEIIKRYKGSNLIYNVFKWLPYSYEHIYNSLVPSIINNKNVKDKAQVNVIYGNSVVENQLITEGGPHPCYQSWTIDNSQGASVSYATHQWNCDNSIRLTIGHKYLIWFSGTKSYSGNGACRLYINVANKQVYVFDFKTQNANIITVDSIEAPKSSPTLNTILGAGAVLTVDGYLCFADLTQWFPFNTPTTLTDTRVQEIINRGHILYNAGTLKNVDIGEISSEPYNLFDEEFVNKGIHGDGTPLDGGNNLSSKNPIEVHGGKSYTFEVDYENSNAVFTNTFSHSIKFYSGLPISSSTFISNHSFSLDKTTKGKASKNVEAPSNAKYAMVHCYYLSNPTEITGQTWCFHVTGTRTGYVPHTQPYTLPFKYQGSGVGTAYDTLEITDTEYVFTKNITEDNLSNYAFYYADSTKFLYTTRELNGCRTDSIWSPNALTNIRGYKLVDSNKLSDNDVACTIYAGKFYIRNDALTEQQLKDVIANKTIKYQLATPQVVRIPKKHLAVVDLGTLNWHKYETDGVCYFGSNPTNMKVPTTYEERAKGCMTVKYLASSAWAFATMDDKSWLRVGTGFFIRDDKYVDEATFKQAVSGIYLFYETQDEVEDIGFEIGVEAGGTLTSNWFSLVRNQLCADNFGNSTTYWVKNRLTQTNNNNVGTFVANSNAYNYVGFYRQSSSDFKKNHKYLFSIKARKTSGNATTISLGWQNNTEVVITNNAQTNVWYECSTIFTQTRDDGTNTNAMGTTFYYGSTSDIVVGTDSYEAKEPMLIDLTVGFGAGNEPTSINDPRIQYIIEQGYIPTNTTGTHKSIASGVLPNIDFKIKCR